MEGYIELYNILYIIYVFWQKLHWMYDFLLWSYIFCP